MFCAVCRAAAAMVTACKRALRICACPLQRLHAAEPGADHQKQALDAERFHQHRLRAHHVRRTLIGGNRKP